MKEIPRRAAVLIGALLVPFAARAATVTTSIWTQFTTTVSQPEVINLGGAIHVVTQITTPVDPCSPTDPCRGVPVTAHLNLAGVTGIGQTTGRRYRATGAADVTGTINMPGGFVVSAVFQLIPPNPVVPPNPIKVQVFMSADASGNVSAPASQPQGLVSWWQAEGDATDALGVNNATNSGAVFVPGRVGQAFGFGAFDFTPYVEAPGSPSLQPANVTVMAWVRNLGSPGHDQYVLTEGAKGCFAGAYALYTGPSGNLSFYVSDGGTFIESPDAAPSIWDGNWHLAAGTYDGASVRLYVDGVQVGQGTPTSLVIDYSGLDHTNFDIGAYRDAACTLGFTGAIDEVRLFNRALAPAEILSIYQTTP